jgi:NADPH:quinone reductase-like Zn-dependent oxidoreductase/thioesterase domain-containing protein/acyl carrier protein
MVENVKRLAAPGALVLLITPCAAPLWARKILSLPEKSRTDRAALIKALERAGLEGPRALSSASAWNAAGYELLTARMPGAVRAKATAPKRAAKPSTWLLIADEGGFAPKLAARLEARGDEVLQLTAADSKTAFLQVLTSARRQARYRVAGVVFLRALDFASNDGLDEKRLKEAEKAVCHATMNLVQALTERAGATLPPLWLVTRGVARVQDAETPRIAAAALTGLARTIAGEYMMLRSSLVDLTPDGDDETDALNLTHEMTAAENTEGEVAWRGHTRFVGRLVRCALEDNGPARALPPEDRAQRVEITTAGVIDQLSHFTVARRAPAKGEVEVEIRAAALNFRDVMKALGIYPSENALDQLLGDECAGIVTRVGPGVRRFKAGDAVLASGLGLFSSHATLPEVAVMPKPTNITFEDAVTLPVTFMTAYYALHTLGHIKKGDKVLVQAGTGGVGLAAIQLAKLAGAEVFATAGSEEKRSFLRALGVAHVADSRSISFADDIRAATGGRGVDLVLNSLAGPAIEAGIACLAPYGRFLEIGKRDIYADSPVGLRPFRNNLSLHVIDMGQVMLERPEFVIELLDPVMKLIRSGKLHPLPSRAVPAAQAVNAFRAMSAAKHIGKIVLSMDGTPIRSRERLKDRSANFDPKGSYLITGGLGGFGLALAELMVHGGARHLVLTGRSGASRPEAVKGVEKLRALGARVTVLALDVTSRAAVHEAVKRCGSQLRGVLHAAAVLDDGILMHMTPERFERVMAPKVAGTWHLHEATLGLDLEVFVLFSSVAALVGSGGQGNYSAANTFMDTFAHYRRSLGLTALSVNWGAITDVGLAARDKKVIANLQASGITGITPFQAGRMLRRMVTTDAPQLGFLRMDWQVRKSLAGNRGVPPRFEELVQASANDEKGKAEARAAVLAAPPSQRPAVVLHHVREIVAGVLRTSAAKLENERPLKEMGLDSLMAFELLLRVEQGFGISLPPTKLSAGGNIKKLAEVVQGMVTGGAGAGGAGSAAAGSAGATQASQSADGPAPDCLVPLRSEGSQPPLFIIHGAGGLLDNVEPLMAALPKTLPVYGLQSRAHADERGEHATLEAAARDYARLIHAQQPEGALRIAGFSAGGFFALAAAHELEKLGRKVALVGLLDTAVELLDPSTSRLDFEQRHLVEMHRYLAHDLGVIAALPDAQVHELSARLSAAVASVPQAQRAMAKRKWLAENAGMPMVEEGTYLDRFLRLFELHWQFMAEIRPVSLSAPVHVWLAVPPGEKRVMPDQVKQLSRSAVQTTILTGHHYEIMNPPAVGTLARQIATALRRAGEK